MVCEKFECREDVFILNELYLNLKQRSSRVEMEDCGVDNYYFLRDRLEMTIPVSIDWMFGNSLGDKRKGISLCLGYLAKCENIVFEAESELGI